MNGHADAAAVVEYNAASSCVSQQVAYNPTILEHGPVVVLPTASGTRSLASVMDTLLFRLSEFLNEIVGLY